MTGRAIVLVNPVSGDGDGIDDELTAWCTDLGLDVREIGDDLVASLTAAADASPPFIAVVGGDGTQRTAAHVLAGRGVTLLPVAGGTFNHFAKAVGLADLDAAASAVRAGVTRDVPVAAVNDESFLNTCAIGWYPEMVRTRESLRRRMPRPLAAVIAFAIHAPRLKRFDVVISGTTHRVWLLWAGNGRFGLTADELTEREDVTSGVLDVRLALADRRLARTRLMVDLMRRRLRTSEHMELFVADSPVEARFRRRHVTAALDAEVVELTTPLVLTPAERTITVLSSLGHG